MGGIRYLHNSEKGTSWPTETPIQLAWNYKKKYLSNLI